MEPLIYTDSNLVDQGILNNATLDLEYGQDSSSQANTFEVKVDRNSNIRLEPKSHIYIEGTEYGGIVKGISTDTSEDTISYKGFTWHGVLNSKVVCPNSGQDYLVLQGDAHEAIRTLINAMDLQDLFTVPIALSGITVDYQVRYEYGYFVLISMLAASSAKLKMTYENGMVVLSAEDIADYSQQDELDTTTTQLSVDQDYVPVNHLVCLGEGELKNRTVVHLYADEDGEISQQQTFFGTDENALIYDYNNAARAELIEQGTEKLKELQNCSTINVDIPEGRILDIGDLVGAIDPITGIYVVTNVTYKVVSIGSNGTRSVEYKVGDTSASRTMTGRSESSGGGVVYSAGKGITIDGHTINADVDSSDLEAVDDLAQEAKSQASNAASTAAGAQEAADAAQDTADAAVATINTSSPISASRDGNAVSLGHTASGVSAGSYGATDNEAAEWGDTVNVGPRLSVNATGHVTSAQGRTVTLPGSIATQDAKGLMSANDKAKLDGIAQGANKTMVDSALSSTSINPVQNKVINTALAGKAASSHTHAATQITGLAASRALATNSSGQVVASSVSNTELSYLDGVTSAVQTQLNNKAAKSHTHTYAGSSSAGGAATSANKLSTARTITLAGAVNGSATFDGTRNITITTTGASEAASFLAAHPVGSIYESINSADPGESYGGTWEYCPGFEFHRWIRTE